jgi:hypothetical protein
MGKCKKEEAFALMDSFYDSGGNFIDTYATSVLIYDVSLPSLISLHRANNYQEGDSERWIGEWMESRGNRDQMVYVLYSPFWEHDTNQLGLKGLPPNIRLDSATLTLRLKESSPTLSVTR